jgi:hypothetical protein
LVTAFLLYATMLRATTASEHDLVSAHLQAGAQQEAAESLLSTPEIRPTAPVGGSP